MKIEKGRVKDLVVQLETWNEEWLGVVRYNYAHGTPHKDFLYRDGRKFKEWFSQKTLEQVVNDAITDLKANWMGYLLRCGYEKEK